jgi:hypothetical protein
VKTGESDGPSSGLSTWSDRNLPPFLHANVNPIANLHRVHPVACPIRIVRLAVAATNSVVLVRKRTIPTERLPLVGEVSANFGG